MNTAQAYKDPYFVVNNSAADVVMQDVAMWDASTGQYVGGYSKRTLDQFKDECGPNVSIMEFDEGYALYQAAQEAKYIGPVKQITQERFEYLLECLPPVNWIRINGTESFKFMERLSGDITYIVARIGGGFYEFNDKISLSHDVIIAKINKAIADGSLIPLD